jgi:guanylate kinase
MSNERGNLIVVSAPSGAGKSSLVKAVLGRVPKLRYSVSCTTRPPRSKERDGLDYHFVSDDEFRRMAEGGEFLEWASVHGHLYGTPRRAVIESLEEGFDVILDIDVQGADQIRRHMPDAVTVFILPPSEEILIGRLIERGSESHEELRRRLWAASREVARWPDFKYVIINDELQRAASALEAIIVAERCRPSRQIEIIKTIVNTFGGIADGESN